MTSTPVMGAAGLEQTARDTPDTESRALLPRLSAMLMAPPPQSMDPWTAARRTASRIFTTLAGPDHGAGDIAANPVEVRGAASALQALWVRRRGAAAAPLLVFFHGGGWCVGQSSDYAVFLADIARLSGASIVSVDYRLAPEHPFPAAYEDAIAATADIAERAAEFGGDVDRLGVMGDSAGGNLAAAVAQHFPAAKPTRQSEAGAVRLRAQFLLYPMLDVASPHATYPSRLRYGNGDHFLANLNIDASAAAYLNGATPATDPRVSPLFAPSLRGLAPAYILAPGCDPLRDEAEVYARRLIEAGVAATFDCRPGAIHAVLSFGVLKGAQVARQRLADEVVRLLSPRAERG